MARPNLDRYLRLERRQDVADGAGGYGEAWEIVGHHWAAVQASSGSASTGEFGAVTRLNLRIGVRWVPHGHGLRPLGGDRFIDGSRRYKVQAVHEDNNARGYLVCFAREEDAP